MAEKEEENRLKAAAETTVVVVDQQPSTASRIKADQDEPSDANHKWSKEPDIPSVAERIKDDLEERSQIFPKPSDKHSFVVARELPKNQAGMQLKTSEVVKPLDNIELTQLTSDCAQPEVKQCAETDFPAKMESEPAMPKAVKRLETTFPAKMNSEPVVSEVVKRLETTETRVIKPAEPIPEEVNPQIKKSESLEKTEEEKSDEDVMLDDAEVLTHEDTRLSDWSDDQETGGLPRADSVSSRMTRAVRQLFCCGVAYYPPSEDNISTEENTGESRKPESSWNDPEYFSTIQLQELQASCSKAGMPCDRPCGLRLSLPQKYKSSFSSTSKSGLHFVISKGTVVASKSLFTISQAEDTESKMISAAKSAEQFSTEPNCLSVLREKLDTMRNKIRQFFIK